MKITDLKKNDIVLFQKYCDILKRETLYDGNVLSINQENKTIDVCYLEGYKSNIDTISFDKIAYYVDRNRENGQYMKVDGFSGWFIKIEK